MPILGRKDGIKIARYVAGYVTKKLTTEEAIEEEYGDGREPEFMLCSRRPAGIGCLPESIERIVSALKRRKIGPAELTGEIEKTDGIFMLRLNGKKWPLDRTIRNAIIEALGKDERTKFGKSVVSPSS